MSTTVNTKQPVKEEIKKEGTKKVAPAPVNDIVQPDPKNEDSQAHIKANAKKGESIYVPNVIGPNPITQKLS